MRLLSVEDYVELLKEKRQGQGVRNNKFVVEKKMKLNMTHVYEQMCSGTPCNMTPHQRSGTCLEKKKTISQHKKLMKSLSFFHFHTLIT